MMTPTGGVPSLIKARHYAPLHVYASTAAGPPGRCAPVMCGLAWSPHTLSPSSRAAYARTCLLHLPLGRPSVPSRHDVSTGVGQDRNERPRAYCMQRGRCRLLRPLYIRGRWDGGLWALHAVARQSLARTTTTVRTRRTLRTHGYLTDVVLEAGVRRLMVTCLRAQRMQVCYVVGFIILGASGR